MKTFEVDVTWEMAGTIPVKAKTLQEAMDKVRNGEDPLPEGEYIDDSFQVNVDCTIEANRIRKRRLPRVLSALLEGRG